eukprot:CAMPEP_0119338504 /NCGR_PEP_ID=MMETSP1333-20130426/96231_1 /TAXON_ID=418940 /ORGANISM="Scyphosphaera apsteinii, Strain RCC1455" /LENGTH=34 /DNA_ID= /DNA_START= /DNA_END= /DNA_ORIENTATION=
MATLAGPPKTVGERLTRRGGCVASEADIACHELH